MKTMKTLLFHLFIILFTVSLGCQASAQKDDKEKTVKIKIKQDINGEETVIDTTFNLSDLKNLDKILEKHGIKSKIHHHKEHTFDIDIEIDDSINSDCKSMVWVDIDDVGKKRKHIIKNKKGDQFTILKGDGFEEEILIEEIDGDSGIITKKIIIKSAKDGHKHHKKKVYKIKSDSLDKSNHVFFFSDEEEDGDNVIIKEKILNNDSIEYIIQKELKGKKGKHKVIINNNGDYSFHHKDIVESINDINIQISNPSTLELKQLKIKKGYKELELKNFFLFMDDKEEDMTISFIVPQKGNLEIILLDENGKQQFNESKKGYEGKYKVKTKALANTFYITIKQGKESFIKRVTIEK